MITLTTIDQLGATTERGQRLRHAGRLYTVHVQATDPEPANGRTSAHGDRAEGPGFNTWVDGSSCGWQPTIERARAAITGRVRFLASRVPA